MTEQTHAEQQREVEIIENIFMLKKNIYIYIYIVNTSSNFKYVGITCSVRLRRFAIHFIYV